MVKWGSGIQECLGLDASAGSAAPGFWGSLMGSEWFDPAASAIALSPFEHPRQGTLPGIPPSLPGNLQLRAPIPTQIPDLEFPSGAAIPHQIWAAFPLTTAPLTPLHLLLLHPAEVQTS